jgi:glycosyltransferase involved in cell wall biosynthesis
VALSQWLILSALTLSSGTGIRLKGIAKGLAHHGKRVFLVGAGERDPSGSGVRYIQVKKSDRPLVMALRLFLANLGAVIRIRPKYCIASKPLPHTVVPALMAGLLGAVIFLDFDDLESGYWQDRLWWPFLRFLERISPRLFHFTCVHTEELAAEAREGAKIHPSRILLLNQGVDVALFSPWQKQLSPARPVILYAAHLGVAAEGLHFVLNGFGKVAGKGTGPILLVIGSGPLLPLFKKEVERLHLNGKVVFGGQRKHEHMPRVMGLARAAVNYTPPENAASRYRASVKVREYLSMGLPVATNIVGSDLESFSPFLEVFEVGNTEGFARAVEQALAQGRSEDAHRELKNNWAWEVVVASFLRQLRQMKD